MHLTGAVCVLVRVLGNSNSHLFCLSDLGIESRCNSHRQRKKKYNVQPFQIFRLTLICLPHFKLLYFCLVYSSLQHIVFILCSCICT